MSHCLRPSPDTGAKILELFSRGPYDRLSVACLALGLQRELGLTERSALVAIEAASVQGLLALEAVDPEEFDVAAREPTCAGPGGVALNLARLVARDTEPMAAAPICDDAYAPPGLPPQEAMAL